MEGANHGIVAASAECGHVEWLADVSAAAPDKAFATNGSGVCGEGSDAYEGGDLLSVELAEFGDLGQSCEAHDTADAGDALEQIVPGLPDRAGLHGFGETGFDILDLAFEPTDVTLNTPAHLSCGGLLETILLFGEHGDELAPARHERIEGLCRIVGQGPDLRANAVAEQRQDQGIDLVGLGKLAGSSRELTDLARIHDDHRESGTTQGSREGDLETPGRLQDDQFGSQLLKARDEASRRLGLVGHMPNLSGGQKTHLELCFADVDSDETICRHTTSSCDLTVEPSLAIRTHVHEIGRASCRERV